MPSPCTLSFLEMFLESDYANRFRGRQLEPIKEEDNEEKVFDIV